MDFLTPLRDTQRSSEGKPFNPLEQGSQGTPRVSYKPSSECEATIRTTAHQGGLDLSTKPNQNHCLLEDKLKEAHWKEVIKDGSLSIGKEEGPTEGADIRKHLVDYSFFHGFWKSYLMTETKIMA